MTRTQGTSGRPTPRPRSRKEPDDGAADQRRAVARAAGDPGHPARRGGRGLREPQAARGAPLRAGHDLPRGGRPPRARLAGVRAGRDGDGRPARAARAADDRAVPARRRRRARLARHRRGAAPARRARGQGRRRVDEPRRPRRRRLDDGRPLHRLRRGEHQGVPARGRQDAAAHRRRGRRHRADAARLRPGRDRAGRAPADGDGRAAALPPRHLRPAGAAQGHRLAGPGRDGRLRAGHDQRVDVAEDAVVRRAGGRLRRDDPAVRGARRRARARPRGRPRLVGPDPAPGRRARPGRRALAALPARRRRRPGRRRGGRHPRRHGRRHGRDGRRHGRRDEGAAR